MKIGVDFDNTIASYDNSMHRRAVERGLISPSLARNKKLIRDAIRALEDGESKWRALQVFSYGPGMPDACAMEGVKDFMRACKARGLKTAIVSHKTEFANFGDPGVNLRDAAMRWLNAEGFVDSPEFGVGKGRIFFEETREKKVARIASLDLTHFIDDLEETFLEPSFPASVEQILFAPHQKVSGKGRWRGFADWPRIQRHLLGEAVPAEDLLALRALVGRPVDWAERVGAGRNSRVYRVRSDGAEYAAKFYFKPTADGRDRLRVEYTALEFLWKRGVRTIAEPLRADARRQVALYRFVSGEPVDSAAAGPGDIDQLLAFVERLRGLCTDPEATALGSAAEAFFTTDGVVANLRQRLARLEALETSSEAYDSMRDFLKGQFVPALERFSRLAATGSNLPIALRTLSPSDLGYHNTLRGPNGRLIFLDFEYFGWDDPAKTLSDCLLHPMMKLASERRRQLADGFDRIFGADPGWRARVKALYPLFALKWCLIMLNEFRSDQIERRRYVDRRPEEIQLIQMRQLEAARSLLNRTMREQAE